MNVHQTIRNLVDTSNIDESQSSCLISFDWILLELTYRQIFTLASLIRSDDEHQIMIFNAKNFAIIFFPVSRTD
jgi:hypothetical protein